MPADGVYFVKLRVERGLRRRLDVFGRRKVGLARAEIDDVDALSPQAIGFGRHLQRRGGCNACHPCCEASCFRRPGQSVAQLACFSRSRSSTTGGTRPVHFVRRA